MTYSLETTHSHINTFNSHKLQVTSLEFSPKQTHLLVSIGKDHTVVISNILELQEIARFEVMAGFNGIGLIDNRYFSCFEEDNSIKIFEL